MADWSVTKPRTVIEDLPFGWYWFGHYGGREFPIGYVDTLSPADAFRVLKAKAGTAFGIAMVV